MDGLSFVFLLGKEGLKNLVGFRLLGGGGANLGTKTTKKNKKNGTKIRRKNRIGSAICLFCRPSNYEVVLFDSDHRGPPKTDGDANNPAEERRDWSKIDQLTESAC